MFRKNSIFAKKTTHMDTTRTNICRAKDTVTGEWVYGYYVRLEDPSREPVEGRERTAHRIYSGMADTCVVPGGYDFSPSWYEVVPETVGMSTGIYDTHEKEIFEGDVVKFGMRGRDGNKHKTNTGTVIRDWCNPGLCMEYTFGNNIKDWEFDFVKAGMMEIEVVGNIHDNPEMSHKGKEGQE